MAQQIAASAWKVIPFFQSQDITRTVSFYTNKLGFKIGTVKPEDKNSTEKPFFASIYAGPKAAVNIYYSLANAQSFAISAAYIALGTDELDQLYELVCNDEDVVILDKIEETPWGWRNFTLADPDGNRLTFFKFLEGGNPGSSP